MTNYINSEKERDYVIFIDTTSCLINRYRIFSNKIMHKERNIENSEILKKNSEKMLMLKIIEYDEKLHEFGILQNNYNMSLGHLDCEILKNYEDIINFKLNELNNIKESIDLEKKMIENLNSKISEYNHSLKILRDEELFVKNYTESYCIKLEELNTFLANHYSLLNGPKIINFTYNIHNDITKNSTTVIFNNWFSELCALALKSIHEKNDINVQNGWYFYLPKHKKFIEEIENIIGEKFKIFSGNNDSRYKSFVIEHLFCNSATNEKKKFYILHQDIDFEGNHLKGLNIINILLNSYKNSLSETLKRKIVDFYKNLIDDYYVKIINNFVIFDNRNDCVIWTKINVPHKLYIYKTNKNNDIVVDKNTNLDDDVYKDECFEIEKTSPNGNYIIRK